MCAWLVRPFDIAIALVHTHTHIHGPPDLVVKLVIEEVLPQSVRKVEDSCDDDTKRTREGEMEPAVVLSLEGNASP